MILILSVRGLLSIRLDFPVFVVFHLLTGFKISCWMQPILAFVFWPSALRHKVLSGIFSLLLSLVIFSQILSQNFYRFHLRHFFKHFKLSFVAVSRQNFNVRCSLKSSLGENRYVSQVEHPFFLLFWIIFYF